MDKVMEKEIWRDVVGFEGLYQISNLGRIKSLPRLTNFGNRKKHIKEMFLSVAKGKRGYLVVVLTKQGRHYTRPIHRMIAEAFIPNPENYPYIDHIDTNKHNNAIFNLRWCTAKGNSNNPLTKKLLSRKTKEQWDAGVFNDRNNIHYRKVGQYTKTGELVKVWDSIVLASETLKIDSSSISAVCKGTNPKRHTVGGFVWKHIGGHYVIK